MLRSLKIPSKSRPIPVLLLTLLPISVLLLGAALLSPEEGAASTSENPGRWSENTISLIPFATVSAPPVDMANSGIPGDKRLFIVQQNGVIQIAEADGTILPMPFLDIQDRVKDQLEMGLLGLAFDPDYDSSGRFYVNYTHEDQNQILHTRISRFEVTADPDLADPGSESIIFTTVQPYHNHNGGALNFGPDGYLYIGLGDGGSGGDPQNRAQNPAEFLGKLLRIDVSGTTSTTNYLIPDDNPFVGVPGALDEIWSLGLRNPWRFTFDRAAGSIFIADVGQSSWEEIDFQPAASSGGENWGWRCYEGNAIYDTAGCGPPGEYDFPIHAYASDPPNCSVTGGYVYRGSRMPGLNGHYLFADYCSAYIWSLSYDGGWQLEELGRFVPENFTTFGEDVDGELYIASNVTNTVYKIVLPIRVYFPSLSSGP